MQYYTFEGTYSSGGFRIENGNELTLVLAVDFDSSGTREFPDYTETSGSGCLTQLIYSNLNPVGDLYSISHEGYNTTETNSIWGWMFSGMFNDETAAPNDGFRLRILKDVYGEDADQAKIRNWAVGDSVIASLIKDSGYVSLWANYNMELASISSTDPTATPIPGAVWLLGSGLAGLVGIRRRMKD